MAKRHEVDVIVVGGGILGSSVAYHLLERGVGDVVLLEAEKPSAGTSGAGGGFVSRWAAGFNDAGTDDDIELQRYGLEFYGQLASEGADLDYRHDGTLFVATTDACWDSWVSPLAKHPHAPSGVRTLDAKETSVATHGVLAADAVAGSVFHPDGIQISAGRANRALGERITSKGGVIRTESPVTHLLVSDSKVTGVLTKDGEIQARHVVLACGAWTNELLAELGLRIPMLRMVATRAISPSSGVSGSMPTVLVPELSGLWLREHRGGFTYGNHEGYAPLFQLTDSDGEPGRPQREELVERLDAALSPELRKLAPGHDTSISWWLQGMPCMTADRRHVIGPIPGIEGLHVMAGDNEAGVTHGPGLGRVVAEIIDTGASSWVNMVTDRPGRFDLQKHQSDEDVFNLLSGRMWATSSANQGH